MRIILILLFTLSLTTSISAQVIGVISALPEEQVSFLKNVTNKEKISKTFTKGTLHGHTIYTILSGIGKVNAASVAQELISKYQVDMIMFSGVAGGMNKSINIGDIVIASLAFQHDYGYIGDKFSLHTVGTMPEIGIGSGQESIYFQLDKFWDKTTLTKVKQEILHTSSSLESVLVDGVKVIPSLKIDAVIATGDQFIANNSKKESLRKFNTDVVEMEGAAVAQVALKNEVPVLIIRSVSDKAGETANIDFKTFFQTVATNNSLLLSNAIKVIP